MLIGGVFAGLVGVVLRADTRPPEQVAGGWQLIAVGVFLVVLGGALLAGTQATTPRRPSKYDGQLRPLGDPELAERRRQGK